ncbi:sigma factor-like helix-turn-helix DNA-binding protein [Fannyhessea vaginae]|uniref:sigma factor-like helix-turn-helix DNA-binding protein n=1 Tax=Fannyhessea vaginae TaxID=82135 RepID=UPI003A7F7565
MDKYILPEGEAHLLVAVFEHLRKYSERAKENDTSVSDELSECTEDISVYADALSDAMGNCLNDREYDVIAQRYELSPYKKCSTREEIARNFNVTRERIRQIEARAIKKIRRFMTEFNGEETNMIIRALEIQAQEELKNSAQAQEQGDSVSEEVYTHNWMVDTSVENKLKIQQAIRKHRSDDEQHSTF